MSLNVIFSTTRFLNFGFLSNRFGKRKCMSSDNGCLGWLKHFSHLELFTAGQAAAAQQSPAKPSKAQQSPYQETRLPNGLEGRVLDSGQVCGSLMGLRSVLDMTPIWTTPWLRLTHGATLRPTSWPSPLSQNVQGVQGVGQGVQGVGPSPLSTSYLLTAPKYGARVLDLSPTDPCPPLKSPLTSFI